MFSSTPSRRRAWFHRQSGALFLSVVFFAFLRLGLHAASSSSPSPSPNVHPIPALIAAAETRFRAKLARQSPTLPAAAAEYRRRHARPPPKGFDAWHAFASAHDFALIDEFDPIVDDLAPFWELTGVEVRRRTNAAGRLPGIDLVRVRGGEARAISLGADGIENGGGGARAQGLVAMMEKFVDQLPDMDFAVNTRSEGRVIVPWEHTKYPNLTDSATSLLSPAALSPDWGGTGSVWEAWRRTCPPPSPARRLYSSLGAGWGGGRGGGPRDLLRERWEANNGVQATLQAGGGEGAELAFAQATNAGLDFCSNPGAHYEQGHFFSDFRTLPALAPVFSPARAGGFGDVRIPSHYYYGGTRRYTYGWDPVNLEQRAVDAMEVPWEKKRDVVWWRGASTGGGSSPPGFGAGYQRHRFLRMASVGLVEGTLADAQRTTPVTFAVPPQPVVGGEGPAPTRGTGAYTTVPVPLGALNADVMDTAFVKEVVPLGGEHRIGDSVELGVGWGYKYLLDLDGMGYSGRFMAFLASDSVPIKATVYDEYFNDWIEPWVHYIPLSAAYAEIYNIVAYFSGAPPAALRAANLSAHAAPYAAAQAEADRALRRIARAGKQWKRTMGRTVDMEVYVYRLALEYARLWADDREAMSYTP
ncbi:capsular associated protein [Mycena maculata]|uniref:Capsular associated protein n=1 Tax=Mycena maculata TaxID=230809 RepID=A0AAD7NXV6_9AGAR|nr:capsular associated protein [Mycena maculata]